MSATPGNARYAFSQGVWILQLAGDLRHPLAPALNAMLDRAFATAETRGFVIDLAEAENIDSTCLGILARIGERRLPAPPVIVGADEDIREVLLAICFDRLFELVDDAAPAVAAQPLPARGADPSQLRQLMLDAHRRLSAIDARNEAVFRDVVQALEVDDAH